MTDAPRFSRSVVSLAQGRPVDAPLRRIALIGNALPRLCGLATFTSHVADAVRARYPDVIVDHYAMDDGAGAAYPAGVHAIRADDPAAYREAAGLIQASGADVIWLQHEFGIFGGPAGAFILDLLDRTTLPVVPTLHTVLEAPSHEEQMVFDRLLERSSHLLVMAERGRTILRDHYDVADARITVVPHGVPDRIYQAPNAKKAEFDLAGRKVLMTFGLLAPDKGVRDMIEAMPALVARHADLVYVVVGATHPNLVRFEGEAHRESLIALADRLGVGAHVRFVDGFLGQDALLDRLESADVYVTPYLNMAQVTSGALSYAVALGKPVVATPYIHATEILADDHGVIVPPREPQALAAAVGDLLDAPDRRLALAERAYARGRDMIWSRFAERSLAVLADAALTGVRPSAPRSRATLPLDLTAVERMTDGTGMLQHGVFSVPDRNHGYCIDDNARALILACLAEDAPIEQRDRLANTYAAFVQHGWNPDLRRFRNFMRYDRGWCEPEGSEDSNGRTLWALGVTAARGPNRALRGWAIALFDTASGIAAELGSPRTQAFAALGAAAVLDAHPGHEGARTMLARAADQLTIILDHARRADWPWFEDVLAYDNARLPHALLEAGRALARPDLTAIGLETLEWLGQVQTGLGGVFRPVGADSFGRRYAAPLPFDQQPLEAQAMIEACAAAFAATGDAKWTAEARRAYGWFLGENDLSVPLATRADGGCYDGLMPHGANANQGAESVLAIQFANVAISALPLSGGVAKAARDAA